MARIKRTVKIAAFALLMVFVAIIILTYNRLSISYKWQDKNNVLLEGWLGATTLEKFSAHIIDHKPDSIFLYGWYFDCSPPATKADTIPQEEEKSAMKLIGNSTIYITPEFPTQEKPESSALTLVLEGDSARGYAAHYSLFINDHLVKTGFAGRNQKIIKVKLAPQKFKTIGITFDNDTRTETGDRNLSVVSVSLNNTKLTSSNATWATQRSSFTNIGSYRSNAQYVKQYLHDLGVDTTIIQTYLTTLPTRGNTLALARKFNQVQQQRTALQSAQMYIFGDNTHALRSFVSFRRAAYTPENIGIYTHPREKDNIAVNSFRNKLKETFTVIFVLLFFHL